MNSFNLLFPKPKGWSTFWISFYFFLFDFLFIFFNFLNLIFISELYVSYFEIINIWNWNWKFF